MLTVKGTCTKALTGFLLAVFALAGTAFASVVTSTATETFSTPEIDPAMATGGLTILGIGVVLLIERYRARR
jgi:hypothetical protein